MVVPGRGRLSDETDVANYRDMVTIVRDRVRAMVEEGHDAGAGASAPGRRPTTTASTTGRRDWTGDMFVEAIYRDLRQGEADEPRATPLGLLRRRGRVAVAPATSDAGTRQGAAARARQRARAAR